MLFCDPKWNGKGCRVCGKVLVGQQTAACSAKHYKEWQKNHWWKYARAAARRRDKYKCKQCGKTKKSGAKLEVHHKKPLKGSPRNVPDCRNHLTNLVTLCRACHLVETNKQRKKK